MIKSKIKFKEAETLDQRSKIFPYIGSTPIPDIEKDSMSIETVPGSEGKLFKLNLSIYFGPDAFEDIDLTKFPGPVKITL